jgi:Mrp family chromosome partitioning ATPase
VLVVGRAGVTKRNTASRAVELLEQAGAPVIGTVVIGAEQGDGFDYAYRRYAHRTDRAGRRRTKAEPASTVP